MIIRKWVEFQDEVEIVVGVDDIIAAISESTETETACLNGLNNVATFLKAIPDATIQDMKNTNRKTIAEFLRGQADRYTRTEKPCDSSQ